MTASSGLTSSIKRGIAEGLIDPEKHAGIIHAAKIVAKKLDTDAKYRAAIVKAAAAGEPIGKIPAEDNVSASVLLKYLTALNLVPIASSAIGSDGPQARTTAPDASEGKMSGLRSLKTKRDEAA